MDRPNPQLANIEDQLSGLLRERTGYEIADLDRDASFLELGFDSLFLIQLSQQIKQRFRTKVTFRQLIEEVTSVDALITYLAEHQPADAAPTDAAESTAAVAATPAIVEASPALEASSVAATTATVSAAATPVPSQVAIAAPPQPAAPVATVPTVAATPVPATPVPTAPVSPPRAVSAPSVPATPAGTLSGIEQIILQQNALMAQHLSLLQGQPLPSAPASDVAPVPSGPAAEPHPQALNQHATDFCASPDACSGNGQATAGNGSPLPAPKPVSKHERFGPYKPVRRGTNNQLTEQQQHHLQQFTDRFIRRTAKSRAHAQTHRDHFADPRGVAGYRRIWKSMVYQIVVERSKGSQLWDVDGNQYVDIAMGFGLNLFGQSPDFITQALHEQLDRGVEVGPQSPIAGEVAQLLCDFARKDRATFCNTGSEAVMAAMRLARTVTGKSKVVYFNKDYHGNFDQVLVRSSRIGGKQVSSPAAPGVPQAYADNMIVLDYGTPEALQAIEQQADEIAAVLIEPVQSADPFLQPKAFLHEIRRITRERDIAMIMDEVITGFRAAPGGAQEWFDVWADMSTYGKILGGGMPIGALAGSCRYMDALDGGTWRYDDESEPEADMTFFAGTFVRHPLGLVAAQQVLRKVKEEGPELQQRLTDRTTQLTETLNTFFEDQQFPIRVAQFASQFRFMFPPDLEYADMLYFHLLDRGVFTRGWGDNCFLSTEHSDEDIAHVIRAVQESCLEIRQGGFFPDADDEKKNVVLNRSAPSATEPAALQSVAPEVATTPEAPEISTLVEIQPDGDKTPLFCAPAADGLTLVYHELSDELGDDQPVYGLNSPGVLGLPLPDTLEEMAAGLVAEIRAVQPQGPYLLIGYCSGGTLALEIAQQLIAAGDRVALLGMIETYNWLTAPSTNPSIWTKVGYGYQRCDFHLRNFLLLNTADKRQFLNAKWQALKVRTKVWRGAVANLFSRRKKRKPAALVNMSEIWKIHDELCEAYVPKPYPGRLIHFRPRRDYRCHLGEELEVSGSVEYHRMRSYPAGMMVRPFVTDLADMLREAIKEGLEEPATAPRLEETVA
ncbi:aminotransferase class III-fold pyridoxal phosphate-dependent enzyme [Roseimaritima ulvae]|uniref:Glutamate-1-semialdehyde 2,1-aminomutase 1 n=1 Tax=Roseimaritima ulvae TaxID=980254 RepID=A0A5B9QIV8_9BACT|nr:aminotransferase class III-fold pyridoxal phosphate-dependent enzyme [Roseimaritima ulvae]QEG38968.1 Glutamate-1-semialdehyde 2,1-aminomutase 1 [Roseimaritima ulvae]